MRYPKNTVRTQVFIGHGIHWTWAGRGGFENVLCDVNAIQCQTLFVGRCNIVLVQFGRPSNVLLNFRGLEEIFWL